MNFSESEIGHTPDADLNHNSSSRPISSPARLFHVFAGTAKRLAVAFLTGIVALLLISSACAQSTEVRVNQVGYTLKEPKRAYLMTSGSATGATFSVVNSKGTTKFGPAPIGRKLGTWGSFTVFALDFDSLTSPGIYKVSVSGPVSAASPSFKIDTGQSVYANALANKLFFYETERDGPRFISNVLRTAPAHLHDEHARVFFTPAFDANDGFAGDLKSAGVTIDAAGGWFDAGDYLKFVETHSYVVSLMLIGVRDFPNELGAASTTSNFTDEAKFGLDWLQKMWDDDTRTLYYQVGIGGGNNSTISDHDIWRLPQADDSFGGPDPQFRFIRHRPVFINTAGGAGAKISPNIAGRLAADFAQCFQVFQTIDRNYADECLRSAEHVFDLANTNPTGDLLTAGPFGFYPETEWRDDLELGATELYFALADGNLPSGLPHTNPMFYLKSAAHWAHAYITGPNDATDTLNLFDVSGLAHFELHRAITKAENPSGLEVSKQALVNDLEKQLNAAISRNRTDPFGFAFPWTVSDTASHGAGLSVMASELKFLNGTFAPQASRWLGNILGANAWGSSFSVGDGEVFPDCMQHQIANLVGSLDGTPPLLLGAVVEGPNGSGTTGLLDGMRTCDATSRFSPFDGNGSVFVDNVQSFNTVEPAIDLTASSILALAWQIATPRE
jgi:endoglucanase